MTTRLEEVLHGLTINGSWKIATATALQYPSFTHYGETATLTDMSQPDNLPDFSGTFRYETTFDLDFFSRFAQQEPSGLLGPVCLFT